MAPGAGASGDETQPQSVRLQRVLAGRGYGSRRVCEELIADGRVTVNGQVAALGMRVDAEIDRVSSLPNAISNP